MIPPGLLVAFTLASTPAASLDGRMGSGSGTAARALVAGDPFGGADGVPDGVDATLGATGREAEAARFADLLLSLVMGGGAEPAAAVPAAEECLAPAPVLTLPERVSPGIGLTEDAPANDGEEASALAAAVALPVLTLRANGLDGAKGPDAEADGLALARPADAAGDALAAAVVSGLDAGPLAALAFAVVLPAPRVGTPPVATPQVVTPQVVGGSQAEAPLDPTTLRGLDRDFARRLTRVAERMRGEYGRTLEVVEGVRSQGRQNELFNQGRTDPGPIVTWTTESLHTIGRAADVWVDGAPVTPESALLLARIAREEGLRTLYPIDSGHIQVDGPGADGSPEAPMPRRAESPAPGAPAPRKGIAPVAPVAPVAAPARAGGVVARDGGTGPVGGSETTQAANAGDGPRGSGGAPAPTPAPTPDPGAPPLATPAGAAPVQPRAGYSPDVGTAASAPPLDPARFETPEALTSYRSVRLPLEGLGEGSALHVGLRGSIVDARLSVADPAVAADLSRGLRELGRQLGLRGLEVGDVAVRLVDGAAEATRMVVSPAHPHDARGLNAGASTGGSSSDAGSQQGRTSGTPQDALEGRERGSRQRKDTNEDRAS